MRCVRCVTVLIHHCSCRSLEPRASRSPSAAGVWAAWSVSKRSSLVERSAPPGGSTLLGLAFAVDTSTWKRVQRSCSSWTKDLPRSEKHLPWPGSSSLPLLGVRVRIPSRRPNSLFVLVQSREAERSRGDDCATGELLAGSASNPLFWNIASAQAAMSNETDVVVASANAQAATNKKEVTEK
jgi:hypothetical protein